MLLSIDSSDAAMPAMHEAALRRSGLALLKLATRALSRDARLLIIVDQFEELFGAGASLPDPFGDDSAGGFWCKQEKPIN
jgi:hypothetical protein